MKVRSIFTAFCICAILFQQACTDSLDQALESEELLITPASYLAGGPGASPDSTFYIDFMVKTKGSYSCKDQSIMSNEVNEGTDLTVVYGSMVEQAACKENLAPATAINTMEAGKGWYSQGNVDFTFQGFRYQGSYKRVGTRVQFDWPFEKGIIFTVKEI